MTEYVSVPKISYKVYPKHFCKDRNIEIKHKNLRSSLVTSSFTLRGILIYLSWPLCPEDAFKVEYRPIPPEVEWLLPFINDIIEGKHDQLSISNRSDSDLDGMLSVLCTS